MSSFDKAWNLTKESAPATHDCEDNSDEEGWSYCGKGDCLSCGGGIDKSDNNFGEKFNSKLDSLKEGGRPVPERFADMKSTTDKTRNMSSGDVHGRDNMDILAEILGTDTTDGAIDEYGRLKDMFDWEPASEYAHTDTMRGPSIPDSTSQALGSKGLIDRFRRAGRTP